MSPHIEGNRHCYIYLWKRFNLPGLASLLSRNGNLLSSNSSMDSTDSFLSQNWNKHHFWVGFIYKAHHLPTKFFHHESLPVFNGISLFIVPVVAKINPSHLQTPHIPFQSQSENKLLLPLPCSQWFPPNSVNTLCNTHCVLFCICCIFVLHLCFISLFCICCIFVLDPPWCCLLPILRSAVNASQFLVNRSRYCPLLLSHSFIFFIVFLYTDVASFSYHVPPTSWQKIFFNKIANKNILQGGTIYQYCD